MFYKAQSTYNLEKLNQYLVLLLSINNMLIFLLDSTDQYKIKKMMKRGNFKFIHAPTHLSTKGPNGRIFWAGIFSRYL